MTNVLASLQLIESGTVILFFKYRLLVLWADDRSHEIPRRAALYSRPRHTGAKRRAERKKKEGSVKDFCDCEEAKQKHLERTEGSRQIRTMMDCSR